MRKLLFLVIFILSLTSVNGQSVGLVLSGGGAKGLYHIGVIKALEESNIPIDYVAGTSIGAIVAGFYAAGYSADEMIEIVTENDVSQWVSNKLDDKYIYYYTQDEVKPTLFSARINLRGIFRDSSDIVSTDIGGITSPTATAFVDVTLPSLIPATQFDIELLGLFSKANSVIKGNFDNLFVPFGCAAADIVEKRVHFLRSGDFSEAIRASMAIPIVFSPVIKDSVVLVDGGVYNNFPWREMRESFNPDFIIGARCVDAAGVTNLNIAGQLELLIMRETNYDMPSDMGIVIGRGIDVGTLDFSDPMPTIMSGFFDTMKQIEEIKARVPREVTEAEVARKRIAFRSKQPVLYFSGESVERLNIIRSDNTDGSKSDTLTVNTAIRINNETENSGTPTRYSYTFEGMKQVYYRTVIDRDMIPTFPRAKYNPVTGLYDLDVKMTAVPEFRINGGLNISSSTINQVFLGLAYQDNRAVRGNYSLDGYLGSFYNSAQFRARHTFYNNLLPFYLENTITYNYLDYAKANNQSFAFNYQSDEGNYFSNELYLSSSLGFKIRKNGKGVIRVALGRDVIKFSDKIITNDVVYNDRAQLYYANIGAVLDENTLNYQAYATSGRKMSLSGSFTMANAKITEPAKIDFPERDIFTSQTQWFGVSYSLEHYIKLSKRFSLGYLVSGVYTNIPHLGDNYVNRAYAPHFAPTEFSKTLFLSEYQDDSFLGVGVMPILEFSDKVYIKGGLYMYKPDIFEYNKLADNLKFLSVAAMVYQSPLGPISLSYNGFSDSSAKNDYFIFSFGYMLFNKRGVIY